MGAAADPSRGLKMPPRRSPKAKQPWYLYMIRCRDGSLYTGIATDVDRRLSEHLGNDGRGARYLRGRAPLKIVFRESIGSKSLALRLERRIKRLPKARKESLVARPEHLQRIRNGISAGSAR